MPSELGLGEEEGGGVEGVEKTHVHDELLNVTKIKQLELTIESSSHKKKHRYSCML